MDVVGHYLKKRDTIQGVIERIKKEAPNGSIYFYPCSKYANMLIGEIKRRDRALFSRIKGIFDKFEEARCNSGIEIHDLGKLSDIKSGISLLVVAVTNFCKGALDDFQELSEYNGKMLKASYFDISLPETADEKVLFDIRRVYGLLEDSKSKMIYLLTWLSRALNDAGIFSIFDDEKGEEAKGGVTRYKNYTLKGLSDIIARELQCELYSMKYVRPEPGDIVFDIGGYKGDTALFFADAVGKRGKVFTFEPVRKNYMDIVDNVSLNGLGHIIVPINKGASYISGTVKAMVVEPGAAWSFIDEFNGNEAVEMTTIDEFVREKNVSRVDFIKIDVEGWEENAISGAKDTIKLFKPKLVVSLYHKTSDLIVLPLAISELEDYKLYIRCKMEGPFGINMYCVKR